MKKTNTTAKSQGITTWKKRDRLCWAESRRNDLEEVYKPLRYVEELVGRCIDAKSWEDYEWVTVEIGNALVDAIAAITKVHQHTISNRH